jgi:hypothetical protein
MVDATLITFPNGFQNRRGIPRAGTFFLINRENSFPGRTGVNIVKPDAD